MSDKLVINGLVLEGGGIRGMYTCGILDTFLEMNIESEIVVGVSAGTLFGVNYLSKQKGRAIRYNKRFNPDPNYLGVKPLFKEGNIISVDYAYRRVPRELDPFDDETFKSSKTKFYSVVTNLKTGEAEYIRLNSVFDQMDLVRGSGSLPFASKPVEIDGNLYLDGGVGDNIPFEWMMNQTNGKIVVISTKDDGYKNKGRTRFFAWVYKRKYPKFAKVLGQRGTLFNAQLEKLKEYEKEGKLFVFRPSEKMKLSRLEKNPDKMQKAYDLGVKDAKRLYESLKEFLTK